MYQDNSNVNAEKDSSIVGSSLSNELNIDSSSTSSKKNKIVVVVVMMMVLAMS